MSIGGPDVSGMDASKKIRKRVLERLKRARQRVVFSPEENEYVAIFVVFEQIEPQYPMYAEEVRRREEVWRRECHPLATKLFSDEHLSGIFTKAEAIMTLRNKKAWFPTVAAGYWEQQPDSVTPDRELGGARQELVEFLKRFESNDD